MDLNPSASSSDETVRPGVSRRTVATAAAWTVPAISLAVASPAAAASAGGTLAFNTGTSPSSYTTTPGGVFTGIVVTATPASGGTMPTTITIHLPAGATWADTGTSEDRSYPVVGATATVGDIRDAVGTPGGVYNGLTASTTTPNYGTAVASLTVSSSVPSTSGNAFTWGHNSGWQGLSLGNLPNSASNASFNYKAGVVNVATGFENSIVDGIGYGEGQAIIATGAHNALYTVDSSSFVPDGNHPAVGSATSGYHSAADPASLGATEKYVQLAYKTVRTDGGKVYGWGIAIATSGGPTALTQIAFPVGTFITQIASANVGSTAGTGNTQPSYYALDSTGRVWSWGNNNSGALGQSGVTGNGLFYTPARVTDSTGTPISGITAIGGRAGGGIALQGATGRVYSWGFDLLGMNGNNITIGSGQYFAGYVLTAPGVPLDNVAKLTNSSYDIGHSGSGALPGNVSGIAVIKNDGSLWSWGSPGAGDRHLAGSTSTTQALAVRNTQADSIRGARTVKDAHLADGATAIILSDGSVWAWGDNSFGATGHGYTSLPAVHSPVSVLSAYTNAPIVASRFLASDLTFIAAA